MLLYLPNPPSLSFIGSHANAGECDETCNTPACEYDGLDCDSQDEQKLVPGTIVIYVLMEPEAFLNISVRFLRNLARLLNAKVDIQLDEQGLPWVSLRSLSRVSHNIAHHNGIVRTNNTEPRKHMRNSCLIARAVLLVLKKIIHVLVM